MKVAEFFASLGVKIEGQEQMAQFEKTLEGIATAARNAALALKDLASARIPQIRQVKQVAAAAVPGSGRSTASVAASLSNPTVITNPAFIGPAQPPKYNGPVPPQLPGSGGFGLPVSVLQGLKSLGKIGLKVGGIATLALAMKKLVHALTDMVKGSMQATFAIDKFTSQTGVSRRELKQWERIAALSDVKVEDLQNSLKALQQRTQQIRWTGEGATPFLQLGIDATASPTAIAKQFAARTQHMDQAMAVFWGHEIGFTEDFVYMLRKNLGHLDELLPDAQLSEKEFAKTKQLNAAWAELSVTMGALADKLTSDIAPAIKWVVDQLTVAAKVLTYSKPARDWVVSGGPLNPMSAVVPLIRMATSGGNKVENNVNVTVTGQDRPKDTGREVGSAVRRELTNTFYQTPPANAEL